jgi:selenium metabolism protein YedF
MICSKVIYYGGQRKLRCTKSAFLSYFCLSFVFRLMRTIDTKGQLCPAPLISTKRALNEALFGESFMVLIDNETSFNNVSRFLKDNKIDFQSGEEEGIWRLTITRTSANESYVKKEDNNVSAISHFIKGDYIVVVSSDKMGDGDEALGRLLITNFIRALKDLDKLPQKMVFYNAGVKLVTKGSPVLEPLKDLEKMGVELLLCATCVSHYSLELHVGAGTLSNMYAIAEVMTSAGNIVKP